MKKLLLIAISFLPILLYSQGGAKWTVNGNTTGSGDFLGTTNSEPLIFKTDNIARLRINANGNIIFKEFDGTGTTGLFSYNANGKLEGIVYSGLTSHVLLGNGTFGTLLSAAGWNTFTGSPVSVTTNKIGIGVTSPVEALEVNGNGVFNGSVSATQFNVGDVVSQGKNLRISTNICLDGYDPLTGMRNELCVFTQPLFINSKHGYDLNTIMNGENSGKVGIGTLDPKEKLHVAGNIRIDGESFHTGNSHFARIQAMPDDSLIHLGDSSLVVNTVSHRIYANPYWAPVTTPFPGFTYIGGMGIGGTLTGTGYTKGSAEYSMAIGYGATANSKKSIAIGTYVSTTGGTFTGGDVNNIVIGRGVSSTQKLSNNVGNSLMIGFNSTIPTIFVGPSSGAGTTGAVGIGTTCLPVGYKLAVDGKILCEEVKVKLSDASGCWPDYVFGDNYTQMGLNELENYISINHHLPNVPTASQIEEEGINTSEMLKTQMEKIEELTKYLIEQNKKIEALEKEVNRLKK